jgi:hypothetical protein
MHGVLASSSTHNPRRIQVTKPISIIVRSATTALIAATLIPGALWAQSETVTREARNQADAPAIVAPAGPSQAVCDKARSDARFLRQMQLTDGDVNPFVELPIRADCRGDSRGDSGGGRSDRKVARVMTRERWDAQMGGE